MTNTHTERYRRGQAAAVGRVIAGLDALARELSSYTESKDEQYDAGYKAGLRDALRGMRATLDASRAPGEFVMTERLTDDGVSLTPERRKQGTP